MFVAILLILLFALILIGVPISFAIAGSSLVVLLVDPGLQAITLVQRTFSGLNSFLTLAIPLFLLTAEIMNECGITDKLIKLAQSIVGRIKGGLAHVNIVVSMVFAGISGSSTADTAGVGSVLIPAMKKKGYSPEFAVSVTAASSTMGVIIPPSIIAVIYAATAGISVGALFIAGIMPGVLIGLSQMVISYLFAKKYNYPSEPRMKWSDRFRAIVGAIPPLLSPVLIIGGIVGGFFTPTEAAVISVTYSLVLALFYRTITPQRLWKVLIRAGLTSSVTLLCIGVATVFGYLISIYRVPQMLGDWMVGFSDNPSVFLLLVFVLFLVAGTFMDATPSIIMLTPIVAPIGVEMGVNPIHLAVIVVTTLGLGLVTPPYGLCLLLGCQIGETTLQKVLPVVSIFIVSAVLIIMLILFFPEVALWVPRVFTPEFMPS
ncbi:MAG: TRAP transporter large permease [Propioniciclava sp.]